MARLIDAFTDSGIHRVRWVADGHASGIYLARFRTRELVQDRKLILMKWPCMNTTKLYRYDLPGGWVILAGKTEEDNDALSLRIAKQTDTWFHVRSMPGSHVILHSESGEIPDKSLVKTAAAVAAWHSKARNGGRTAVSCTLAQNVTKPRGAKPGTVSIRNERVIMVRPELPKIREIS